jgi:hypothetical protein
MFLFLFIASHVIAMNNKNKDIELVKIHPEQITDDVKNERITLENPPEQLQIKIVDDEDLSCAICLQPFKFGNGKFKVEIIEEKFMKDHKIHDSNFHEECIRQWMKGKINPSCPICRKQLLIKASKKPFLNQICVKVEIELKKLCCNPGFYFFIALILITIRLDYACSIPHNNLNCEVLKLWYQVMLVLTIITIILFRRVVQ